MPNAPATTRRTKIVCTLGPSTASAEDIRALAEAGMNVARLNFSHGSREDHAERYRHVREASEQLGKGIAVLADLQGPKVRLGSFAGGGTRLEAGSTFTITTEPCEGTSERASTTYAGLTHDVPSGSSVLIDDGRLQLAAESAEGSDVRCRVIEGGPVSDHKGINVPGVRLGTPALSDKDMDDLRFALDIGVDLVALSFVHGPEEADVARGIMDAVGRRVPLIAKVENATAVEHLEPIVEAFDGLMVARGDLGVETPLEQVPLVQKRAVAMARQRSKPVIVATQMLESMVHNSRPTRAEASDVANAALDGADALMLSAETSVGHHASTAVRTMARIIEAAERERHDDFSPVAPRSTTRQEALARAAPDVGRLVQAAALVAFTQTGTTAHRVASQRSPIPLLAITPDPQVRVQLAVAWGVEAFVVPQTPTDTEEMVAQVDRTLVGAGRASPGDMVVIIAGSPWGQAGTTNMLRLHWVDQPLD